MKKYVPTLTVLTILAVIVTAASWICVWTGDELRYQFNMALCQKGILEPVHSLGDIIASQNYHYFSVNGRYTPHVLVQLFNGILGQHVFAVCNGLVYALLVVSMLRVAGVAVRRWVMAAVAACMALVGLSTFMGPSCQIGYVWMGLLVIWFLLLYKRAGDLRNSLKWWAVALSAVYAFVVGVGQEAINSGVCIAIIADWWIRRRRYTAGQYALAVAFGAGSLLGCISPANFAKVIGIGMLPTMIHTLFFLRVTYLMFFVALAAKVSGRMTWREIFSDNRFLWMAWGGCLLFNLVIGVYCNRQLMGCELFASLVTLRVLKKMSRRFADVLAAVVVAGTGIFTACQFHELVTKRSAWDALCRLWETSRDGTVYFDLPPFRTFWNHTSWGRLGHLYNPDSYDCLTLEEHRRAFLPTLPPLRVLPAVLSHTDTIPVQEGMDMGNGYWLYKSPAGQTAPSISLCFTIGPLKMPYKQYVPDNEPTFTDSEYDYFVFRNEIILVEINSVLPQK